MHITVGSVGSYPVHLVLVCNMVYLVQLVTSLITIGHKFLLSTNAPRILTKKA